MKKILIFTLFAGLISVLTAADFKHPGFSCTDKNKIAAALVNADTPARRCSVLILQRLAEKAPENFNDLCKIIDEVTADANFGSELARSRYRMILKKQFALHREQCEVMRKDAIEFCIQNPSEHDAYYFVRVKDLFTIAQRYAGIKSCLLKYNYQPQFTLTLIEQLVELGIDLENVDVKADLDKLNKKFSLKLVRDKAAWTPVVQNIRTALSTF